MNTKLLASSSLYALRAYGDKYVPNVDDLFKGSIFAVVQSSMMTKKSHSDQNNMETCTMDYLSLTHTEKKKSPKFYHEFPTF